MLKRIAFTLACLVLPIVWGVFVNWLFQLWHRRRQDGHSDDSVFPDYQI